MWLNCVRLRTHCGRFKTTRSRSRFFWGCVTRCTRCHERGPQERLCRSTLGAKASKPTPRFPTPVCLNVKLTEGFWERENGGGEDKRQWAHKGSCKPAQKILLPTFPLSPLEKGDPEYKPLLWDSDLLSGRRRLICQQLGKGFMWRRFTPGPVSLIFERRLHSNARIIIHGVNSQWNYLGL